MKQGEQRPPKRASTVWDLAEFGFEIIGDFSEHTFIGLLIFVAVMAATFLFSDGRSTFQDW
jgi:hypothetical protein